MTAPKRSMQDRRVISRDKIILSCRLMFEGNEYSALITDISPGGAFLLSDILPPVGADISIATDASLVGIQLVLDAKILRYDMKKIGRDKKKGFAIQFRTNPPELAEFIDTLAKPQIE
jgi:hypothetical protein